MFTDMVGSTAMAQADESAALRLREEQESIVRPVFSSHRGREIKSMGDGFLVEFDSALRAVECAIEIQRQLNDRNSRVGVVPLEVRIGVHVGDVEQRAGDIFGDAVNIASRIEPLAPPRGVCITGEVYSQVHNKIPNKLVRLPATRLKGVQATVDVYRVELPWSEASTEPSESEPTGLAVLPFANISPDPRDEYFADGLTEELITELSRLPKLRVIARTSVVTYKSSPKSVAQIGTELGVTSILEGSVRKSGDRLRITVQLIDVRSQGHTWASTFDRELTDVFAVQGEIAQEVARSLRIRLRVRDTQRLEGRPKVPVESYLAYLKGRTLLSQAFRGAVGEARAEFERAIELDDRNAAAFSGLADALSIAGWMEPDTVRAEHESIRRKAVARALELDPSLAEAHVSRALILWRNYDYREMDAELELAIELRPSYSAAHLWYGQILAEQARAEEALTHFVLAEAADPLSETNLFFHASLLCLLGRFNEVSEKLTRLERIAPNEHHTHRIRARYYLGLGDRQGALAEIAAAGATSSEPRWTPLYRAWYHIVEGDADAARAVLREEETLPEFPQNLWHVAWLYAQLHDLDRCLQWLERSRQSAIFPIELFRLDANFSDLRADPRFTDLLGRANLA